MDLDEANQKLKTAFCRFQIQQINSALYLRGVLPPKPGSKKSEPHQQRIPCRVKANRAGVKVAYTLALRLENELALGAFDWAAYVDVARRQTVGAAVAALEQHYWDSREKTLQTQDSWATGYGNIYKRMDPDKPLTEAYCLRILKDNSRPDSRNRLAHYYALTKLMKSAGVVYNIEQWATLKGSYSTNTPKERVLLSDEEIIKTWHEIDNHLTAYCWGMMATFGFRTHELWHLDCSPLVAGQSFVLVKATTKSKKTRRAYALPAEWIDLFGLRIPCPFDATKAGLVTNRVLGRRISHRFETAQLTSPYTLRHCYRARAFRADIDTIATSRSMGHSPVIGHRHYTRWIQEQDIANAFEQDPSPITPTTLQDSSDM